MGDLVVPCIFLRQLFGLGGFEGIHMGNTHPFLGPIFTRSHLDEGVQLGNPGRFPCLKASRNCADQSDPK